MGKDLIMEKTVYISFNKISGARVASVITERDMPLENQYLKYKKFKFDPEKYDYVGDYDKGTIMLREDIKPQVYEYHIDIQCAQKIEKLAPVHKQLNSMSKMFEALIAKGVLTEDDPGVEEFTDLREAIDRSIKNNKLYKEARQNSDYEDYVSNEDMMKEADAQLAGGLNTIIGRV